MSSTLGPVAALKRTRFYSRLKFGSRALRRWLATPAYCGNEFRCPVCSTGLRHYKPIFRSYPRKLKEFGFVHPIESIESFNVEAYSCPRCDASDRERLYALFFSQRFRDLEPGRRYRFFDFAPSWSLSRWLRSDPRLDYVTIDLFRWDVDLRISISDMAVCRDASVDMFLCSHVLEHVPDDRRAMAELHRILAPGGCGLVMVPLVVGVEETQEDPAMTTAEQRWKHYAQDDHLRLYGREDLARRLTAAGFVVRRLGASHFGAETFRRSGIHANSVLYVVEKPAA